MYVSDDLVDSLTPGIEDPSNDLRSFWGDSVAEPLFGGWSVIVVENDWETLLDPNETPAEALAYLAQFVGVRPRPSWSEADLRSSISHPEGFRRGTRPTVLEAAKRTLTGTQSLFVIERVNGDPDAAFIRSFTGETPSAATTKAAIEDALPYGIVLDYDVFTGQTFATLDAAYASFNAVDAAYASFDELLSDLDLS